MSKSFQSELMKRLVSDLTEHRANNVDTMRFSNKGQSFGSRLSSLAASFVHDSLGKFGWRRDSEFYKCSVISRLTEVESHFDGLEWLYQRLSDEISRQTLVEVVAYRILGHRHTRLKRANHAYWEFVKDVQGRVLVSPRTARINLLDGWLDDFDLSPIGRKIILRAHKLNVLDTFLLEQYKFNEVGAPVVEAEQGDIVIDGGGCWGDTALYFADNVGSSGRVHVFEFSPANLELMRQNLERNPALKSCIDIHEQALWNNSEDLLSFGEAGPATTLSSNSVGALQAKTRSIDDWASTGGGRHVDYIKLDIEGAERLALEGARKTIQSQRPKLAVALYHSLSDFTTLPKMIDDMHSAYRFHLGHYTIHQEETVLFATCR